MRIAQVAPLYESCPPVKYGGTERVVSWLTEELVRQGHDVTLFASGDSRTSANLVAVCEGALRLQGLSAMGLAHHERMIRRVFAEANQFDIIHFHIDFPDFWDLDWGETRTVMTLHGRLDVPGFDGMPLDFGDMPLVSISDAQRKPLPGSNWVGTVQHGLMSDRYPFGRGNGGYLAFLGRICPEKRVDRAIEIAKRTGRRLLIAAKVDEVDQDYYHREILPLLDDPDIQYIGEIGEEEKLEFLGNASVVLFPIDWPEPFGLVMIEAMATGTPVIAYSCGSVPEIIDDGVTGFIVDSLPQAVAAVARAEALDRKEIRRVFMRRFSVERMAEDYLSIYQRLLGIALRPEDRVATAIHEEPKYIA